MSPKRAVLIRDTTGILTLDEVREAFDHLSAGLKHCRLDEYRAITLRHADRLLEQAVALDPALGWTDPL